MLPGSRFWYKISKFTGTPIIAVWLNVLFCICINLIGLGSYTAIAAIFNVTAIALDWSYCIPIICKVLYSKRLVAEGEGQGFTPGPWNLGRFSWYINVWAVVWTFFVSIVFVFPTFLPVTPTNMNYAIVILAGISLFAWYEVPLLARENKTNEVGSTGFWEQTRGIMDRGSTSTWRTMSRQGSTSTRLSHVVFL